MRLLSTVVAVAVGAAALPAWADKRLDDAVAKAEVQIAKGKPEEAVKILQKAVAQAPVDPEPSLALAKVFLRLGRLDDAGSSLKKAGELAATAAAPVRARVRASQSGFALRAGTSGEALTLASQAVEASAGAESLAALALAQSRQGEPVARETAERALKAGPSSAAAHLALGSALLAARLDVESEAAFREALRLGPASAAASAGLARALAGQGKGGPALEAAQAAMQADAHSAEAQAALGLAALAQDPEDRKSDAMAAIQQASLLEPKNPLVALELGQVFESRGQLVEAAAAYGHAAELDPGWPAPKVAALALQAKKGDLAGALAGLRASPKEIRSSGEAELLLGRLSGQKEDWPNAHLALEAAAVALPGLAEAHAMLGTAAYNVGDLKEAADAYSRATAIRPDDLAYLASYGTYLAYDGRAEQGLAVLLRVTARPEGQTAENYLKLGGIYRGFKPPRVAEAVAAYEKAQKLDPKNGQAALGIAQSYRAGKQWARAISAYENIEQAHPRLKGEALLGTAWCHYRAGDVSRARFFTGLAVREGADVTGIRQALSLPAEAAAPGDDLAELLAELRSKSAGTQARAAQGLLGLGRPAVPALAEALARKGMAIAIRERIVEGLGGLGATARDALPQLDRLAKAPPVSGSPATSDSKASPEREAALAAKAQAASDRIRAGRP